MTIPLTGYASQLSVRPNENLSFHVSYHPLKETQPIQTSLVRVINADPYTNGGVQTEPMENTVIECVQTPTPCPTQLGSHARVELTPEIVQSMAQTGFVFEANIYPTLRRDGTKQTIASVAGLFELFLDARGILIAEFCLKSSEKVTASAKKPLLNQWTKVVCRFVPGGEVSVGQKSCRSGDAYGRCVQVTRREARAETSTSTLFLACSSQGNNNEEKPSYDNHFNGRIEAPKLWWTNIKRTNDALRFPEMNPDASWDFGVDQTSQRIVDTGPHKLHGTLFNCPTRGVRGSNWSGEEMCWRHAPNQYAAIHFHSTDLSDCRWPVCYQWKVPAGTKSGNYALLLKGGDEEADNIPFFVVPPRNQTKEQCANRAVVIVSTFTYVIYGNHARGEWLTDPNWIPAWKSLPQQHPTAYPYNPREHPQYGWSTYNNHADGSGICLSSWHRPLLNLRLGYVTFPYPEKAGSGLRHYPADTHLTAWLEAQSIEYDVVTDWELHTEGSSVLEPYKVALTGSHPEYHSEASLKALREYKDQERRDYKDKGGSLMYLGGNGFYWKIAVSEDDALLEIRRGEGGVRAWASDPGEYYHQLDGRYGGLWRRNGRPPQELAGVGFTAQGSFASSHYRLAKDIRWNERVAWMLEGIDTGTDVIGNHGLSGHGAAGFELDRMDVALGTPDHAIRIASSEGHVHSEEAPWILVFEERLTTHGNLVGVPDEDLIRADICFFETNQGGAVFSTGSITYCGSLLTNQCQNNVSTLTRNVLLKFLDPRPRRDLCVETWFQNGVTETTLVTTL